MMSMRIVVVGVVAGLGAGFVTACAPDDATVDERGCEAPEDADAPPQRRYAGPCRSDIDDGIDGTVDRYFQRVFDDRDLIRSLDYGWVDADMIMHREWSYDEVGRTTLEQTFDPNTGDVVEERRFEYDGDRLRRVETRDPRSGDPAGVWSYVHGDDGEVVRIDVDRDGNGSYLHRYVYDYASGVTVRSRAEYLEDGDWHPIWERTFLHDDAGFVVFEHYEYQSEPGGGEGNTAYTNDAFGNALAEEHIDLGDGSRMCTINTYVCD